MNIVNYLKREAIKHSQLHQQSANKILDLVKQNLDEADKADLKMLNQFGVSDMIEKSETKLKTANRLSTGDIVLVRHIKKLCDRYDLKFLPIKRYIRSVPLKVLHELRLHQEAHKEEIDNPRRGLFHGIFDKCGKYYIIAPVNHFSKVAIYRKDPAIIYIPPNDSFSNKKNYDLDTECEVVSMWGSDFNFLQRLKGFCKMNRGKIFFSAFMIPLIVSITPIGDKLFVDNKFLFAIGFIGEMAWLFLGFTSDFEYGNARFDEHQTVINV